MDQFVSIDDDAERVDHLLVPLVGATGPLGHRGGAAVERAKTISHYFDPGLELYTLIPDSEQPDKVFYVVALTGTAPTWAEGSPER